MPIERKDAKQLLTESVMELAEKKTINKIGVAEIARNCRMSNSNFYHHFSSKYELISYIINTAIDERIDFEPMSLQCLFSELLDILEEEPVFYTNVLSNTLVEYPNHAFFHEALDAKIKDLIITNCMYKKPDRHDDLILHVYLAGITAAMCSHLINHRLGREELMEAFIVAMPDRLRPLMHMKEMMV